MILYIFRKFDRIFITHDSIQFTIQKMTLTIPDSGFDNIALGHIMHGRLIKHVEFNSCKSSKTVIV